MFRKGKKSVKKIICILSALLILVPFAGCKEKRSNVVPITKGITFNGEVTYYNECFECFVKIEQNGDMVIEMNSPDSIKGMAFEFIGNKASVKYEGLEYNYDISSMPAGIVGNYIYGIFNDTHKEDTAVIFDKDNYYITGDTGKYHYKMYVGQTGLPILVEENRNGFTMNIKDAALI